MPKILIDDREFEVKEGELLIEIMLQNGISIPHFCYHESLGKDGNCRMCMVEIEGQKRPQIACDTPVKDGMVVRTKGEKIEKTKRGILELELVNHPVDCPVCDQAGECKLQDYYMDVGLYDSRLDVPKVKAKKHIHLGSEIMLDQERCVLCKRCVRFTQIYTKTNDLIVEKRSDRSVITTFPGSRFENGYTGNVVDLCPVGALTDRDFRFKKRVWFLTRSKGICTGCSRGCNIWVDHDKNKHQDDTIYRFKPRRNDKVNGFFMCDYGRYSYKKENENRLYQALLNNQTIDIKTALKECENIFAKSVLWVADASLSLEELAYIKALSDKEEVKLVAFLDVYTDDAFEDKLLKKREKASNINAIKLLGIDIVDDTDEVLSRYEYAVLFNFQHLKEKFSLKKVINFTTTDKDIADFYLNIPIASVYEKNGTYINCDWILQKSEKIISKDIQPLTLIELLARIEKRHFDENGVWKEYLSDIKELKGLDISLVGEQGYKIEAKV
ncbi:MAG: 2Fe-2S iron-sulfur cluster binding domain-containing protein [Epsilonproteobacteria bacterium]|nr:2Fe-2S iron-sulfur cluster binding domain-containing protein [Campylobacterota bacterium]